MGWDPGITVSLGMLAIMGIDWGMQYSGLRESTNGRRFVTGMLGGAGYLFFLNDVVTTVLVWCADTGGKVA